MNDVPKAYAEHIQAAITGDAERLKAVWSHDGVVEFPYARTLGTPDRLDGITAITDYFAGLRLFNDFQVGPVAVWPLGEGHWLAEFHASSTKRATGALYEQDYIVRFHLGHDGRLTWLREYWDPARL
ncbi:nuclear transport factor 2 family protein [Micromonospora chokoriensis]